LSYQRWALERRVVPTPSQWRDLRIWGDTSRTSAGTWAVRCEGELPTPGAWPLP